MPANPTPVGLELHAHDVTGEQTQYRSIGKRQQESQINCQKLEHFQLNSHHHNENGERRPWIQKV